MKDYQITNNGIRYSYDFGDTYHYQITIGNESVNVYSMQKTELGILMAAWPMIKKLKNQKAINNIAKLLKI